MNRIFLSIIFFYALSFGTTTRVEAAVFTVTTTADSGTGSLRDAILSANASPGSTINFSIGSGIQTIAPSTDLPTITAATTIDGSTQPGFSGTPLIVINCSAVSVAGLSLNSDGSTIKSLVINNNVINTFGILIEGNSNTVLGCFIGTDPSGTVAVPLEAANIRILGGSNNVIGSPGQGNLLSGSGSAGIIITATTSNVSDTVIQGNLIGTDLTGTAAIPNGGGGSSTPAITLLTSVGGRTISGTIIGGLSSGQGNVIAGNLDSGIALQITTGGGIFSTSIVGNLIGVTSTGTTALPNQGQGILLDFLVNSAASISGTIIESNVISANTANGIQLGGGTGGTITGSTIQNNHIGTDATNTLDLGNTGYGILITTPETVTNNQIGGTGLGQGNSIAFNTLGGILVTGATSILNPILGNSDFNNGGNGITLLAGGNALQEPPTIDRAIGCFNINTTRIFFTAPTSPPASNFRIEFFDTNQNRNPAITEGQTFLAALTPITTGEVASTFVNELTSFISGTATNLNNAGSTPGNTSQYSLNAPVTGELMSVTITKVPPGAACSGTTVTLTTTITGALVTTFNLLWSDGLIQTGQQAVSTRTITATNTTLSLRVLDLTTLCEASSSITISEDDSTVSLTASRTEVCVGATVTLTALFTGTAPRTLTWSDGLVVPNATSPFSREFTPAAGTTTVSVILTDGNECNTTSNPVSIRAHTQPVATLSAKPAAIELGRSATLTLSIKGTGPFTVIWSDGKTQSGNSPITRIVSPRLTTTFSARVTDNNQCTTQSNSVTVGVFAPIIPPLSSSLQADPTCLCPRSSSLLKLNIKGGLPPFTIKWPDGKVTRTHKRKVLHSFATRKDRKIRVRVVDSQETSASSNFVTIRVFPHCKPPSNLTQTTNNRHCKNHRHT